MTVTMNHDEFDNEHIITDNYNIIYGKSGWTDEVDDGTIDLLEGVGAIRLVNTYHGVYNRTRIYVSVKGKEFSP